MLHTPSEDTDRFSRFAQPLIQSLEESPAPHVTDETWKQHMIQLHNREAPKKRSRAPRGGVKRKHMNEEEELVWSLENMLQSHRVKRNLRRVEGTGEADCCSIDYLHCRHGGNVSAAEINLLADLSAGRGKCSIFFSRLLDKPVTQELVIHNQRSRIDSIKSSEM